MNDPCILFAMRRESAPFCRAFTLGPAFPGAPCWARFCGGVLVAETGVGQTKVGRVLDWLLAKPLFDGVPYEPRLIVYAGFAGALTNALHIGDIIVAEEIVDEYGHSWRTTWPAQRRGRLVTVDQLTATSDEKRRLGERHQADASEMESAPFAARCTDAGRS